MREAITSLGYDNRSWVLVDEQGVLVTKGQQLTDFRGDHAIASGGRAPHKPSSKGFVYVVLGSGNNRGTGEFYPSVFNCRWVNITSEAEA